MATKGILAPQHTRAQQALDVVVGRLNVFLADKGPQRRLNGKHILAEGRGTLVLAGAPQLQPLAERVAQWCDPALEVGAVESSAPKGGPGLENAVHHVED